MSMTDNLMKALKKHLKSQSITYRDIGEALDLSEASVKRIFAEKNISLARLEKLCHVADIDFGGLIKMAEDQIQKTDQLTVEQEKAIVSEPKFLLVGVCLVNRYTFEEILEKYNFEKPELIGVFTKLDKMGIIELLPNNRYHLKISPDFKWQPGGPIQRFFVESLITEYMVGEIKTSVNDMHFVWGMLSKESAKELSTKIRKLVDEYVQLTNKEAKVPSSDKLTSSLMVIFNEDWEPSQFKKQWQSKHGLKKKHPETL